MLLVQGKEGKKQMETVPLVEGHLQGSHPAQFGDTSRCHSLTIHQAHVPSHSNRPETSCRLEDRKTLRRKQIILPFGKSLTDGTLRKSKRI